MPALSVSYSTLIQWKHDTLTLPLPAHPGRAALGGGGGETGEKGETGVLEPGKGERMESVPGAF